MENRRAGHWLSTQETATVLSTLAAYMTTSGELAEERRLERHDQRPGVERACR